MSIEVQGHFFTIYFPGFVCFVLYLDKISGERLQDHWFSGLFLQARRITIISRVSSKFGPIRPRTAELAAFERLKKIP